MTESSHNGSGAGLTDGDLERLMVGETPFAKPDAVSSSLVRLFEQAREIADLVPEPIPDPRLTEMFARHADSAESIATRPLLVEPHRPLLIDCDDLPSWSGFPAEVPVDDESCSSIQPDLIATPVGVSVVDSSSEVPPTGLKSMARSLVVDRLDRTSVAAVLATAAVLIVVVGFATAGLWRDGRGQPTNVVAVDEPDEQRPATSSGSIDQNPDAAGESSVPLTITTIGTEIVVGGDEPTVGPPSSDVDAPEGPTASSVEVGRPSSATAPDQNATVESSPPTVDGDAVDPPSGPIPPTASSTPVSTVPAAPPSSTGNPATTVQTTPTTELATTTTVPPTTIAPTTAAPTTVQATTTTVAPTTTSPPRLVYLAPGWTYVVPEGLAPGVYVSITSEPCEVTVVDGGGGVFTGFFAPGDLTVLVANYGDQIYTSFGCPGWYQESR